ncbi:MAG: hypothetical protein LBG46_04710 [Elusimicrobiota bacterium]|jgi:hypothetical protein|nr:hypothetical protein [Elusimicrobiota bacterium]
MITLITTDKNKILRDRINPNEIYNRFDLLCIGHNPVFSQEVIIHGEIPPYAIAGGNPVKVFKYRDIKHYKKLKQLGKFN